MKVFCGVCFFFFTKDRRGDVALGARNPRNRHRVSETSSSSSAILWSVVSNVSSKNAPLVAGKPVAEILVEGELSPFEHEALYKLLKKHFQLEQPSYSELLDETIGTRVNITFHHRYERSFFTNIFQEDWRDLKELFKQIRYRRGRVGAAFTLTFIDQKIHLVFSLGLLEDELLGSAM